MNNVTYLRQWKENKEFEKREEIARRAEQCARNIINTVAKALTGNYQVLLESKTGMIKRLDFYGLPPPTWRLPVPASIKGVKRSEDISPFAPVPEIMEFSFVAQKGNILHYKEIY